MSIVTEDGSTVNLDEFTKQLTADAAAPAPQEQQPQPDKKTRTVEINDDELPEKFRGKGVKEILESYTSLQSQYGRVANDLGTQRQITDRLLGLKRENDLQNNGQRVADTLPKLKSSDVLDNPTDAIASVVDARLTQQNTASQLATQEALAQRAAERFLTNHPDYAQVGEDPNFVKWLNETPSRARLGFMARNGSFDVADELVTEYKASKKTVNNTPDPAAEATLEAARKAGLESSAQRGDGSGKGGKIYKRADLLTLKQQRPDEYYREDFQKLIIEAYAENRVK